LTNYVLLLCNSFNLMIFDGLSNNNEIISNLKHYQSISKITHLQLFSIFKIFFRTFLKVHRQDCQNNPFSRDPSTSVILLIRLKLIFWLGVKVCEWPVSGDQRVNKSISFFLMLRAMETHFILHNIILLTWGLIPCIFTVILSLTTYIVKKRF
jgi:hypothetical protein